MSLDTLLPILSGIAAACAAMRIVSLSLAVRQPALLTFLGFTALANAVLSGLPIDSVAYGRTYAAVEVLLWCVSIAVVREMIALVLTEYPGIRSAGRKMVNRAVAGSSLVSVLAAAALWGSGSDGRSPHLFYLLVLDRSVVFTLAVIIISLLAFLSRYPLDLSRNVYISTGFFSAIFLSQAVQLLIDSLSSALFSRSVDLAQAGFAALCMGGWAFMLRREGPYTPRVAFRNPREAELLQQLESLNRLLGGAGRQ